MEHVQHYEQARRDLSAYEAALARAIADLEVEHARVQAVQRQLGQGAPRTCPLCGGSMRDLSPLVAAGMLNRLGPEFSPLRRAPSPAGRAPVRWECQECQAHDCVAPPEDIQVWHRALGASSGSFARKLFTRIDDLRQVGYDRRERSWYLRLQEEWFVFWADSGVIAERLRLDEAAGPQASPALLKRSAA